MSLFKAPEILAKEAAEIRASLAGRTFTPKDRRAIPQQVG